MSLVFPFYVLMSLDEDTNHLDSGSLKGSPLNLISSLKASSSNNPIHDREVGPWICSDTSQPATRMKGQEEDLTKGLHHQFLTDAETMGRMKGLS